MRMAKGRAQDEECGVLDLYAIRQAGQAMSMEGQDTTDSPSEEAQGPAEEGVCAICSPP